MLTSKLTKYSNVRGHAVVLLACEQALLFRRVNQASQERTSEGPRRRRGLSSAPRGFTARSHILARLALLAQRGELARCYCPLFHNTSFIHRLLTGQVVFANSKDLHFFKACCVFLFLLLVYYWGGLEFQSPGSMHVSPKKFIEYPTPLDPRCRVHNYNYLLMTFQWLRYSSWGQMINIWRWSWARKLSHFLFQFT